MAIDKIKIITVSDDFSEAVPSEPNPGKSITAINSMVSHSNQPHESKLVCKDLLFGQTLSNAKKMADDYTPKILANTQILSVFGNSTLDGVNRLNDKMLDEKPPVDIPELNDSMKYLARQMRGIGKKYDPSDPKVIKKYEKVKAGILNVFRIGKSFFQEFLDDIRSSQKVFEKVTDTLEGKQYGLLRNVSYYDEFYLLNEQEIENLIFIIGVMEIIRDKVGQMAHTITVGNTNLGDRGSEEQARLLEIVTILDNRITAFKARLWVAWAMAPQIRNMRALSVGLSARIDQTISITIPTMKSTIAIWLTLSEAQMAEQFNKAVEDTYNMVLVGFANAAKATVPILANALATPALDPLTIVAWSESLSAQADGIIEALENGRQKRVELEQAMIAGKNVIDASTNRINESQLNHIIESATQEPLQISRSVPE